MSLKINKTALEGIRKKHGLSLILLHGSQVDGRTHKQSDVDIAVLRSDHKKPLDSLKLIGDLVSTFHNDKIDLADLTHANPLLLFTATQNAVLLSGNKKDLDALQLKAFHRYNNYLPYFKEERQHAISQLQKI